MTQGSVMKWLKRMLGLGGVDTEAVMDHALQLARSGQQVEAIAQMQAAVSSVKESAGCPSCEYAKGLFNLAMLHLAVGDTTQGAEDCRLASDSCPDTTAGKKDRLMYLMNAGQLLNRAGQTDEAIEVLQANLREREAAYGPEHAGTAYGQQALAEVYMSAGRFAEGLELSEQALTTFLHTGHHEFPTALATTTALASAVGLRDDEVWRYAPDHTSSSVAKPMIDAALVLAESMPDATGMKYLNQLADWACELLPPDSPQLMNVIALWSNLATDKGDHPQRQLAMERAVDEAKKLGDPAVIVNVLEGRALMLSDIQSSAEVVREAYEQALTEALDHDLESDAAGVLRNWALYESESGNPEQAVQRFSQAIEKAQTSGDDETLGRTQIALGIFHQHNDRPDAAIPLLEEGVEKLDPMHPDVACAMLHQVALTENLDCPCHGGESIATDALSQLAQRFFNRSGLEDIIESVTYGGDDGEKGLKVQLSRQPSEQEMQRLGIAHGVFQNLLANADGRIRE
jgi:tetratricopeptide (TPR) repeat protein